MFKKKPFLAFLKNFTLFCVSLILALVVGEYAIRYYFREITTTSCNVSYFSFRWARENVQLNSWWFRDREMEIEKPAGVYRIAIIGDSITYGQGVAEKDRFPNLLEDYLNEGQRNDRYEVLNFGWLGSETIDHVNILKNTVFKMNPDFVLLQWYINDVEGNDKSGRPEPVSLIPIDSVDSLLYHESAFYYLLNLEWQDLVQSIRPSTTYDGYLFQRFGDPESQESREYAERLREFIGLCRDRHIPSGLVLFPAVTPGLKESYPFRYLHERVVAVCAQETVPCIDLLDTFAQYEEYKTLWVNRFDNHPSPLAHRLAAKKIMERFGRMWLDRASYGFR